MTGEPIIYRGGAEWLTWTGRTDQYLTPDSVAVAFVRRGKRPDTDTTWHPAEVVPDTANVRLLVVAPGGPMREDVTSAAVPHGRWDCFIRVADFPEEVIRPAGQLTIDA